MTRLGAALVLPGAAAAVLALHACQGVVGHEFGGYLYDPAADCLEVSGFIDELSGPPPAPCLNLTCWESPAGVAVVTDTQCDAPPDYQNRTHDGSQPCVKALAAYGRPGHGLCPDAGAGGAGGGF